MPWEDSVKLVYLICNPEKEPAKYRSVITHLLMNGVPKERLKLAGVTWHDTINVDTIFTVYNPFLDRGIPRFSFKSARLSKQEISLNLNFHNAVRHSLKDLSGSESLLILTSGVKIRRDFTERLSEVVKDLSGQVWDYVILGESDKTQSYYSNTKLVKPDTQLCFNSCKSVLLSKRCIENLNKTFIPFKESLESELNYQMLLHNAVGYICSPSLTY
jgi:hypothetical protein